MWHLPLLLLQTWNLNYQPYICNGCHDATLCAQAITGNKIIMIKSGTYRVVKSISYEKVLDCSNQMTYMKNLVICKK